MLKNDMIAYFQDITGKKALSINPFLGTFSELLSTIVEGSTAFCGLFVVQLSPSVAGTLEMYLSFDSKVVTRTYVSNALTTSTFLIPQTSFPGYPMLVFDAFTENIPHNPLIVSSYIIGYAVEYV